MPLLNFQPQFADKVASGAKRQTIRAYRKDGRDPKPGDTLYLYTGTRTSACRKLGEVVCREVIPMHIRPKGFGFEGGHHLGDFIKLYGHGASLMRGFAKADGFSDWPAMCDWFEKTHGLPFRGLLIRW